MGCNHSKATLPLQGEEEVEASFHDSFHFGRKLGEGSYAEVFIATPKNNAREKSFESSSQTFAVKVCDKTNLGPEDLIALEQEIAILQSLKGHDHIVQLYSVYREPSSCYLVMEYMAGGELLERVITLKKYTEMDAMNACSQILKALEYCHDHKTAHRDIKLENILLSDPMEEEAIFDNMKNSRIKVGDFGFAISSEDSLSGLKTSCGTPLYVAPEILKGKSYGYAVDMWSFGVLVYILLCGYAPFRHKDTKQLYRLICTGKVNFDDKHWGQTSLEAKHFITSLLTLEPSRRLTATEAMKHSWFTSLQDRKDITDLSDETDTLQDRLRLFNVKRKVRAAVYTVLAVNKFSSLGIQFHTMMASTWLNMEKTRY